MSFTWGARRPPGVRRVVHVPVAGPEGFRDRAPRLHRIFETLRNLATAQAQPAIRHGHLNLLTLRILGLDGHVDQGLPVLGQVTEGRRDVAQHQHGHRPQHVPDEGFKERRQLVKGLRQRRGQIKGATRPADLALAPQQGRTAGAEPRGQACTTTQRHPRRIRTSEVGPDRLAGGVKQIGVSPCWQQPH